MISDATLYEKYAGEINAVIENIALYNAYCNRSLKYFNDYFGADNMRETLRQKLLRHHA